MKDALREGYSFEFRYTVPENRTVPHLFPESPEFQEMPHVFATGYMVGLFEWACVQAVRPHLDWPREQTVGIYVNFSHVAATPPGLTITVKGHLDKIDGKKLSFSIVADDGVDRISEGTHDRFIINSGRFSTKARDKALRQATVEISGR